MFDESFVPICQVTGVGEFVSQLLGVAVDDGGDSVDLLPCLNTQLILRFVGFTVWGYVNTRKIDIGFKLHLQSKHTFWTNSGAKDYKIHRRQLLRGSFTFNFTSN